MSGVAQAIAAASATASPPPAPLSLFFGWDGAVPLTVTGTSGGSSGIDRFHHIVGGGVPPYTEHWTITANPSGKLSLFPLGTQIGVAWSDMAINEAEYITVEYVLTDSSGTSLSARETALIKRTG